DHEFRVARQAIGKTTTFAVEFFLLELIGKVNEVEELGSIAGTAGCRLCLWHCKKSRSC
ncbi:MAG: hypothetical protein IIA98_07970, partial [Proteobacteria bacterium]|nr:hypothetical protein [Pseudomonadota bacterium]